MLHRSFRSVGLLAVLISIGLIPSANAAVMTTGCAGATSCTLLELMTGGSIQAGDLVFSDFSPWLVSDYGAVNETNVIVTGLDDGSLDPGPGLLFTLNGEFDVNSIMNPAGLDLTMTFLVGPPDPPLNPPSNLIKDSSISLVATATGGGSLSGVEQELYDMQGGDLVHTHVVDVGGNGLNITFSSTEFTATDSLFNSLKLRVWPGSNGTANLTSFEIHFSQQEPDTPPATVPEPGSLSLMAAGLIAALAMIRKRHQA